jgi:hypothetical protein
MLHHLEDVIGAGTHRGLRPAGSPIVEDQRLGRLSDL